MNPLNLSCLRNEPVLTHQSYVVYSIDHQSYVIYSKDTVSLRCLLYELIKFILVMEWTSIDPSILCFLRNGPIKPKLFTW